MDLGIVATTVDEIGHITHPENVRYTHGRVIDAAPLSSNGWAVLARAAQQTGRLRLDPRRESDRV